MTAPLFTQKLLAWHKKYGRKHLPWQEEPTPYRVWVSEIMLQQTQVNTVIPYYLRFMERFPTLQHLAEASLDSVLQLWAGLGYYSRARNLHKAAHTIAHDFSGIFPHTLDELMALPGIGRSTAGAILAFSYHQVYAILDGNVRRVLSRFYATETVSWEMAEALTPGTKQIAQYTQAIMDLGATLCTRTKPTCHTCPVQNECQAYQTDSVHRYPIKKIKKQNPIKHRYFLILQNQEGEILLYRRPEHGLWGGLWSLPEAEDRETLAVFTQQHVTAYEEGKTLLDISHTFSHYTLIATPIIMQGKQKKIKIHDTDHYYWHHRQHPLPKGIPALITKILKELSYDLLPETKKRSRTSRLSTLPR